VRVDRHMPAKGRKRGTKPSKFVGEFVGTQLSITSVEMENIHTVGGATTLQWRREAPRTKTPDGAASVSDVVAPHGSLCVVCAVCLSVCLSVSEVVAPHGSLCVVCAVCLSVCLSVSEVVAPHGSLCVVCLSVFLPVCKAVSVYGIIVALALCKR